jgi:hypothetical protein
LDTVLVEADRLGGFCLIRGCIPSKALMLERVPDRLVVVGAGYIGLELGRRNAFSLPTPGSTASFTSAAITFPPTSIEPPGPKPSSREPRSPVLPLWCSCSRVQTEPRARSRPWPIKLTVPRHHLYLWRES